MNAVTRMVVYWYAGIIFLSLLGTHDIPSAELAYGIIFSTIILITYLAGSHSSGRRPAKFNLIELRKVNWRIFYSLSILSILGSYYLTIFYTGKSLGAIFLSLQLSESNYNSYQLYNAEQGLSSFAANQIPAFSFLIFCKFWLVYIFVELIAKGRKVDFNAMAVLVLSSVALIYQSLGRGTSIEIFEVGFLLWFCLAARNIRTPISKRRSNKVLMALIVLIGLTFFDYNISSRFQFSGELICHTRQMCFDPNSTIGYVSDLAATFIYQLNGYFTFGLFFISKYIEQLVNPLSALSILDYLLPVNFLFHNSTKYSICNVVIDCGVNWMPDAITYIEIFGFPLLLILVFAVGRLTLFFSGYMTKNSSFVYFGICYYLVILMASLPVGSFVFSSYASMACAMILVAILGLKYAMPRVVIRRHKD